MRLHSIAAALLVAGCTVGPDYQRPKIAVPSSFIEAHSARPLQELELESWWNGFGDPELSTLVTLAISQNLDVENAAARIREARARERIAGSAALPQVDAQASASRQRISENAIPIPPGAAGGKGAAAGFGLPGSEFNTFRVGFDASWEIDLFGKTRRSIEAARARTGAAIWNQRDVQLSVAAEVADAYLTLRTLQQRTLIAEAELARQQRAFELAAARARGGLVNGQDVEQQGVELASAKAAIPPLHAEADVEIHKIGVLTGQSPDALIAELTPARARFPIAPEVPAGLPSDLLRRRPDIRAAEQNLHAATADIGVATAELYPSFSLSAAPALVSTTLLKLLEWGSRSFTATASADWPLFTGGRARANIAVANSQQQQALIAYRKAVLGALQDVEDALGSIDGDRRQLTQLNGAFERARRVEDIARARFRGGLVTDADVLQAQAKRISIEGQLTDARGALAHDTVRLFKALGGGWPGLADKGGKL